MLRHGDDVVETMPAAGTNQVGELESYLRGAGLDVTLDMDGYDRAQVPAHIDMALFTVAREACTNAVKHAQAHHATLRFAVEDGAATLLVADDGVGCGRPAACPGEDEPLPQAADGAGHGVAGMAERVRVLGGWFAAGDAPQGGFCVRASIPLKGTEA